MRWTTAALLACVAVLAIVAAGAAWLAYADHKGGTYTTCDVEVEVADAPNVTFELPPRLLDEHPPLRDALAGLDGREFSFAGISCEEREALSDRLDAAGAPRPPGPGPDRFYVRHEERTLLLTLSVSVA